MYVKQVHAPGSAKGGRYSHPQPVVYSGGLVVGLVPVIMDLIMGHVGRHIGGHEIKPFVVLELLLRAAQQPG